MKYVNATGTPAGDAERLLFQALTQRRSHYRAATLLS
jgi:hypothetical protein